MVAACEVRTMGALPRFEDEVGEIQPPCSQTGAFECLWGFADAKGRLECGLRLRPRPSTKSLLASCARCRNGWERHTPVRLIADGQNVA